MNSYVQILQVLKSHKRILPYYEVAGKAGVHSSTVTEFIAIPSVRDMIETKLLVDGLGEKNKVRYIRLKDEYRTFVSRTLSDYRKLTKLVKSPVKVEHLNY